MSTPEALVQEHEVKLVANTADANKAEFLVKVMLIPVYIEQCDRKHYDYIFVPGPIAMEVAWGLTPAPRSIVGCNECFEMFERCQL